MQNRRLRLFSGKRGIADVAGSQAGTDSSLDCYLRNFSGMVKSGRTQAACLVKRGLSGALPETLQEDWSRGCPRAQLSYLVFACWRLLPPAQRKKKPSPLWKSRLRPSRPTRASTSDLIGRADQTRLARHAVFDGPAPGQNAATSVRRSLVRELRETSPVQTFIRQGGLSACRDLVLQTVAAPIPKDRTLC